MLTLSAGCEARSSDSRKVTGRPQLTADSNILSRVASGEESAVADCLNRYGGLVWSLARRSCPDQQTAEDAVQEIFLHVWRSAARFDPSIASEATFIATIARRKLIDRRRKKTLAATGGVELEQVLSDGESACQQLELKDEAERAARLLEQLPGEQQRVIRLSIYEGLSHSRIAEATGLSLGTVKTHIRRGLIRLREALFAADASLIPARLEGGTG